MTSMENGTILSIHRHELGTLILRKKAFYIFVYIILFAVEREMAEKKLIELSANVNRLESDMNWVKRLIWIIIALIIGGNLGIF